MACLAPEIAGQTSDGQLCWGDCALGWPVWIRGALLSVTRGCLCVPAAAAGKLAVQREKKRQSDSGKCASQSDLFWGTDSIGHLVAF